MTANQMAELFLIKYDKVTSFAAPGYDDVEISAILNDALEAFIKKHYRSFANKYKEGFEATEKRRKDLNSLVRGPRDTSGVLLTSISSNQNAARTNGRFFDLPNDFWLAISEEALTDKDDCTSTTSPKAKVLADIKPITHDIYTANKRNPFRKPYVDGNEGLVWRIDYSKDSSATSDRHELITDGTFNVTEYILRYIKKPVEIVVDRALPANQVNCELNSMVHREIVAIAVEIATGITNPQEYQVKAVDAQNKE